MNTDRSAPPTGGASARGRAASLDHTAPPGGGASARGRAASLDQDLGLDVHTYESPIGPLVLAARGDALAHLHLPMSGDPPPAGAARVTPVLERAARQLAEYFAGTRTEFDLALAPEGTAFQRAVWDALRAIPFGVTRSYGQIAAAIARPLASRAVGAANGRNPIAVIIPCHRVIGASGALTGFGGGLPAKQFLLAHERATRTSSRGTRPVTPAEPGVHPGQRARY